MSFYSFAPPDRTIVKRLDTIIEQQAEIIALLREQMRKPPKNATRETWDMGNGLMMVRDDERPS